MNTIPALTILAAEEAHVVNPLFLPAWVIGVGSFLLFLRMLAAIMSRRSARNRHEAPVAGGHHGAGGHEVQRGRRASH